MTVTLTYSVLAKDGRCFTLHPQVSDPELLSCIPPRAYIGPLIKGLLAAMFPVQVEFHRDELLVSYAGRTARANGLLGVANLFKDLEISPQAFHAGGSSAIERFASVAGIDPEQAGSQTFIAMADDHFAIAS